MRVGAVNVVITDSFTTVQRPEAAGGRIHHTDGDAGPHLRQGPDRAAPEPQVGSAAMASGICDSCGSHDELIAVHRLYVTPEAWDTPGSVKRMAEVEHWCFACSTHCP